jgi:hypothetical protein
MTTIRVKGKKAPIAQKITLDTWKGTAHISFLIYLLSSTKPVPPMDHYPLQLNAINGCIVLYIPIPLRLNNHNRYSVLGKRKGTDVFSISPLPYITNNNHPTI